ncbi:hypothetical protein AAU57_09960 [Nonlabens sp. YIK11]|uniref:hypothetical protein n=1 Tax=Nonlabens sp. YIK11 TaxID=1453349 RepID=UPI0006DBEA72|nr:hypothetical protein [Nonlabens sp. YIK11]KQC33609.1 hypothetical protein AAU57_09960 [Nonlabens sp. YIK11]
MKKVLSILFVFSGMALGVAQHSVEDISGAYHISSNDPHGGSDMIISPDHHFAIAFFGGVLKGTWQKVGDHYLFTYHKEPKVVLYARYNSSIQDSVKVRVGLDANRGFAIRFNGSENDAFTAIFNEAANCFTYPYIYSQRNAIEQIEIYQQDLRTYVESEITNSKNYIFSFKPNATYNELLLTGLPKGYSQGGTFQARFMEGQLFMEDQGGIPKRSEYKDINAEDLEFFEQYFKNEIFPEVLDSNNEQFPYAENPTDQDLVPFIRIRPKMMPVNTIVMNPGSLFYSICED